MRTIPMHDAIAKFATGPKKLTGNMWFREGVFDAHRGLKLTPQGRTELDTEQLANYDAGLAQYTAIKAAWLANR